MNPDWIDVSNYSLPFTDAQIAFLVDNGIGVCIGLQNAVKAKAFKAQCVQNGIAHDYYVDLPGRDLTIPETSSEVWIDIEGGCFTSIEDVRDEGTRQTAAGLSTGIYGNATSIKPLIGDSEELAPWPLWYANYPNDHHVPAVTEFVPFNGWLRPHGWQYSSLGIAGINCDLSVEFSPDPIPAPAPKVVVGVGLAFDDGSTTSIWP